jgi:ATP phosphoribosyltransferase regulatory subunit
MERYVTTNAAQTSYPAGTRMLLLADARRRRDVEARVMFALEHAGYGEVILPIVDFVEAYGGVLDERTLRLAYRFTDGEGNLLAIRSDFTPLLARAIAPTLDRVDLPLRVFYRGDVIRRDPPGRLVTRRESFQIGAELVGSDSFDADAEILELAARCIANLGIRPALSLTDVRILGRILETAESRREVEPVVSRALRSKRTGELAAIRDRVDPSLFTILSDLVAGAVTLDDLESLPVTAEIARRLRSLANRLASCAEVVVALDEPADEASYYTALRFQIFAAGTRIRVGRGGRYDALYGRFGNSAPAIGFTLNADDLQEAR